MDAFYIGKHKIYLKHEYRGTFQGISGCTSGDCCCLGPEKNRAGFFQVREIFYETLQESFSCHFLKYGNREMAKILTNRLINILFYSKQKIWKTVLLYP